MPELSKDAMPPVPEVVYIAGGPVMTVVDTGAKTGLVFCRWMRPTGEVAEAAFDPAHLHRWSSVSGPRLS